MKILNEQTAEILNENRLEGNVKGKENVEDKLYKSILYQMEVEKVYLLPDLSLVKLSQIVGTNTSYLSKVVNHRFGSNFRTLVNKYRVVYAIGLMRDAGEGCSIDEVLRQSGFVSRSVFYDAFLRVMGKPPSRCFEEKK